MKAFYYLVLVSSVSAQTITVESLNEEQATSVRSALQSYATSIEPDISSIDEILSASTIDPGDDPYPGLSYSFDAPNTIEYAVYTLVVNEVITSTAEATGALETYVSFAQSVARAQASIFNSMGSPGPMSDTSGSDASDSNSSESDAPDSNLSESDAPDSNSSESDTPGSNTPDADTPDSDASSFAVVMSGWTKAIIASGLAFVLV